MTTEDRPGLWLMGAARHRWQRHESLRFVLVGIYNTLFGYLAFAGIYLLVNRHIHYLVILVLAHILAVTNAFIGHKYLTYRATGHVLLDYLRFNLTYAGGLSLNLLGLSILVELCKLSPLVAQAIVIPFTMVLSYFLHKRFSFRRSR